MTARKDWDTYFMDIAYMASTRSRCNRRHVGAVLVQGKKLLGTAYNGAPRRPGLLGGRLHAGGRN